MTKDSASELLSLLCDNPDGQAFGAIHSNQYILMDCYVYENITLFIR